MKILDTESESSLMYCQANSSGQANRGLCLRHNGTHGGHMWDTMDQLLVSLHSIRLRSDLQWHFMTRKPKKCGFVTEIKCHIFVLQETIKNSKKILAVSDTQNKWQCLPLGRANWAIALGCAHCEGRLSHIWAAIRNTNLPVRDSYIFIELQKRWLFILWSLECNCRWQTWIHYKLVWRNEGLSLLTFDP